MNAPPAVLLDARYRVGSTIARGGMSTVYRGTDTRLDRPVAIKIMDARLACDPAFRTRFQREARSVARLDHPNVVDVYDQGDHQGPDGPALFLVMELVDGGTLRDLLRHRGALGVPAAVAVVERVLAGLAEAHRLGLVHRDVKPENVLISRTGEVKVADFGLVVAAAQAGHSHVGMIMGTVAYLSPEQVTSGAADARSDVYGAGVLFYELLTGTPPYTGETAISVAYRHVNSDVPAPSDVAADVPPELDDLIRRATSRDPGGRPADAARLLVELRRVAEFLEIPRVPVPVPPLPPPDEYPTEPQRPVPASVSAPASAAGPRGTRALPRPPAEDAAPPHLRARRRSRRLFAVWTALVLLLAAAIAVSAWWLGSGRFASVPDVVGESEATAVRLVEDAGLVAKVVQAPDETPQSKGLVISADRAPLTELLLGSTVTLTVSTGPPTVPYLAPGTPKEQARQILVDAGFEVRDDENTELSEIAPRGTLARTEPRAGTEVAAGSTVTLITSLGRPVRVPNVEGLLFAEAEAELTELGLEADEDRQIVLFGDGRVIRQSHGANSEVPPGTVITLTTRRGPF